MGRFQGGGTIIAGRTLGMANNSRFSGFSANVNCRCRSNTFNNPIGASCHHFAFHVGSRRIVCHGKSISIVGFNRGVCCRRGRGRNIRLNGRCSGSLSGTLHTVPLVPMCGRGNSFFVCSSLGGFKADTGNVLSCATCTSGPVTRVMCGRTKGGGGGGFGLGATTCLRMRPLGGLVCGNRIDCGR